MAVIIPSPFGAENGANKTRKFAIVSTYSRDLAGFYSILLMATELDKIV